MLTRIGVLVVIGVGLLLSCEIGYAQANQAHPSSSQNAQGQIGSGKTASAASGSPQSASSQPGAHPVENYAKYRFFFEHLENLDKAAANFESQGKQTGRFREFDQDAAHLTDAEGQIMKKVAYDCNGAVAEVYAKRKAIIDALRAEYPHKPLYKMSLPPELEQLEKERVQIINSHMEQLKAQLGEASFQKLDNWVQSRYKSAVAIPALGSGPGVGVKVGQPVSGATR